MSYPIPNEALDDRLGFIGTAGSGKTYNAGGAVERLLSRKARVVIIDPLGVWWGLRLSGDGKHASGFNVAIFGGPKGDLPLNEHAGALIGETAATMAESCIVDLRELGSKASERRFMTAFLETIYRKASGESFHLVVDEADLFAPQKPSSGDETLLGHMENIVRRGRVKGFVPWLISQRPAVLNKNVLSQVDGLVAFKLTSSQDRDALDAWIEGQADRADARTIKDTLPTMQVGQGVLWLPSHGILKTVQFPQKLTFDSSRTPKRGEKQKRTAALKPLDLGALKDKLATVEAETKANDPKALRAELSRVTSELKKVSLQQTSVPDKAAIAAAEKRGFEQAKKKLERAAAENLNQALEGIRDKLQQLTREVIEDIKALHVKRGELAGNIAFEPSAPAPVVRVPTQQIPKAAPIRQPKPDAANGDVALPGPERRILNALASWKLMGHEAPSNAQVAWLAGYSPTSTGYTNPRSALRTKSLIDYPSPDRVQLTSDGESVGEASVPAGGLLDHVLSLLPGPERRILAAAAERYPQASSNDEIAQAAGYSPSSTGYTNPRSALRTKSLIDYPGKDMVRASDWLFPQRLAA